MNTENYIKSQCEHCGEFIEFPERGLGEVIECPHCNEQTTLKILHSNGVLRNGKQINTNQKILVALALLAFILTVFIAPWEQISISILGDDHSIKNKTTVYNPIWEQPNKEPSWSERYEYHLLWSPLLGTWIAIGVLSAGSFLLLKNTPSIITILKQKQR